MGTATKSMSMFLNRRDLSFQPMLGIRKNLRVSLLWANGPWVRNNSDIGMEKLRKRTGNDRNNRLRPRAGSSRVGSDAHQDSTGRGLKVGLALITWSTTWPYTNKNLASLITGSTKLDRYLCTRLQLKAPAKLDKSVKENLKYFEKAQACFTKTQAS